MTGNSLTIRSLVNVFLIIAITMSFVPASNAEKSAAKVSSVMVPDTGIKQVTVNDYLLDAHKKGLKANRLIDESSPYLLQHAYNPVDWYPWGEAAFERARKENKPIFLSIGYSTCHWCHVMAHESFENKKIADFINKHFIAIKVDREQRPDVDAIYMLATEVISGHGGWPMSVFLDKQLRPFHAATYYPPFSVDGRRGLYEVLSTIDTLWRQQAEKLDNVAASVTARITDMADDTSKTNKLAADIYQSALQQMIDLFDEEAGGFSAAPKFPQPGIFALLNSLSANGQDAARKMTKITLDAMAAGGIYDQLAGGFHRYSVDADWKVPHFEKMLYNQSLMIMAYSDFYRIDPQPRYREIVYQTFEFLRREMRSPQGGYYSALDADSELFEMAGAEDIKADVADGGPGIAEGVYYLWRESDVETILDDDEFEFIKKYFDLQPEGNIYSDPDGEFAGLNIFYIDEDYRHQKLTAAQKKWLSSARKKLNAERLTRPRPKLDDKLITAWNGMLLSAFARAAIIFDDKTFSDEAIQIAQYVKRYLYHDKTQTLFRHHRESENRGKGADDALLVDYVWMINGLLEIYKADRDESWLKWAETLLQSQDKHFLDTASGVYFDSTASDANILFRPRSITDGALPAANAIALLNLRMLSDLKQNETDKQHFTERSERLVSSFSALINEQPIAASMLLSVEFESNDEGRAGKIVR